MVKQPVLKITKYARDEAQDIYEGGEGTIIGSVISASSRLGIETIKDVFDVKIPNTLINASNNSWSSYTTKKNPEDNYIKPGDVIKVESYYNEPDIDEINNIIMVGEVSDYTYDNEEKTPVISFSGANITENLLSGFAITSRSVKALGAGESSTVSDIVIETIDRLNTTNLAPQQRVFAALDNEPITFGNISDVTGENGNIARRKSNGDSFPDKSYTKTWQPVYKILSDISAPEYTDDGDVGNYIFYIKPTRVKPEHQHIMGPYINELVFKPASTDPNNILIRGEDYSTISTTLDITEVKNVLIVKPGTSSDGTGITTYVVEEESLAEHGPKYGFWSKPELGNAILKDERIAGLREGYDFDGYVPTDVINGTPWTFLTISPRDDKDNELSGDLIASDEDDFHSKMRDEITARGRIEAQRIVNNLGQPTFKSDVELITGSNNIGMGTLIELQDKTSGWLGTTRNPNYKLRVRDIRHSWDDTGWNTTLVCVEDEKVLSEKVNI